MRFHCPLKFIKQGKTDQSKLLNQKFQYYLSNIGIVLEHFSIPVILGKLSEIRHGQSTTQVYVDEKYIF